MGTCFLLSSSYGKVRFPDEPYLLIKRKCDTCALAQVRVRDKLDVCLRHVGTRFFLNSKNTPQVPNRGWHYTFFNRKSKSNERAIFRNASGYRNLIPNRSEGPRKRLSSFQDRGITRDGIDERRKNHLVFRRRMNAQGIQFFI